VLGLWTAVLLAVVWVHRPALKVKALWLDDDQYMVSNRLVLNPSWSAAGQFFSEVQHPSTVAGYYQPLTMISLMLDRAGGGGPENLDQFHRTSLALHVLNTILVVVLLTMLFGNPYTAAMVGLLFGVHPLTAEPIAWITERKTLLAAFFSLASLAAYLRYAVTTEAPAGALQRAWYAGSIACYALALLSKPTSTTLPFLFLLLDYWPLRRLRRSAIVEKIPFFLLAVVAAVVTIFSQQAASTIIYPGEQSPGRIVLIVCHNVVFYLMKVVWPADLSPYYAFPDPVSLGDPMVLAGVVGTGVLLLLLAWTWRRTPAVAIGWLFFIVAIFPTMGVIGVTNVIAADKYAYLPSLGLMLPLAWLLARTWSLAGESSRAGQAAICAVVLALAAAEARATRHYLTIWRDTETLHTYVLDRYPRAWALHCNFGDFLAEAGRMEAAVGHYRQAIAVKPNDFDSHYDLANALLALGRKDEAVTHYRHAMELRPTDADVSYNLGVTLVELGKLDEAVALLRRALMSNPDNARANHELGVALAAQGNADQALTYYRKAVELQPEFTEARVTLADTLAEGGHYGDAATHYRVAVRLDPGNATVHNNLAVVLQEEGRTDEAITHYREALRLDPTLADVRRNLGNALIQAGRSEEAAQLFRGRR
jgi:tetratricopeptide (TPR) repeat protein